MEPAFFDACCHPVRIALIQRLIEVGPADIGQIASAFRQHRSVVSRHLMQLEHASIVTGRRIGRRVTYEINGPSIVTRLERLLNAARAMTSICCPGNNKEP